jgi:DNA end-binding protein Ku
MAARSIASLSLTFGLVSIPVKLYSATESSSAIGFTMLDKDGSRVKQQYVSTKDGHVVERADMIKGYEFEKDRFVTFTPDELKALQESPNPAIEIIAFIPVKSVDPLYYDKPYLLAPDKRGAKPYNLLLEAMRRSERCALAKWSWKGKQVVVQVRAGDGGLVLQQLLYANEVRSFKELDIEHTAIAPAELQLALQLIEQISKDSYDPTAFEDEERQRILAAIDEKIAGHHIVVPASEAPAAGAQVIDLMEALRASLGRKGKAEPAQATAPEPATAKERKAPKRAAKAEEAAPAAARARARK